MSAPQLRGAAIALSVSPPADLGRLGYVRREFDGLVFELALQIIRHGGRVLYGGHLHPNGMTTLIFEYLAAAYASGAATRAPDGPRPVVNLLAATELRNTSFQRITDTLAAVQNFVELRIILAADRWLRAYVRQDSGLGQTVLSLAEPNKPPARLIGQDALDTFAASHAAMNDDVALSSMRKAATELERARIVVGGRRGDLGISAPAEPRQADRFSGSMPGIYEEMVSSLPGVPVAILAAYGGAAREAAFDLGLLGEGDPRAPYLGEEQKGVAEARALLTNTWLALSDARRAAQMELASYARRDDGPTLARDVVRKLASMVV